MLGNVLFALIMSIAATVLFPSRWAPWPDVDDACHRLLAVFLGANTRRRPLSSGAWAASYAERVTLFKYAVWGSVLVLLLPLHRATSTTWLVDSLWSVTEFVRHNLVPPSAEKLHLFPHHDWREAEYELWEICVFLWVFPILGRWIRDDYVTLVIASNASDANSKRVRQRLAAAVQGGQLLTTVIVVLSAIGASFLVIVQLPQYRLLLELLVILFLTVADLWFARQYVRLNRIREAVAHLEILLIVDLGALIAFVLLFLFVRLAEYASYQSHWTSSFVAGAAALNLVFASTASLVLRSVINYRHRRHDEDAT